MPKYICKICGKSFIKIKSRLRGGTCGNSICKNNAISISLTGKKRPEISGKNHPMYGTHPIAWNKGKTNIYSKKTLKIFSELRKGKHFSPLTEIKKNQHLSSKTEFKKGQKPYNWKNGKHLNGDGYVMIYKPEHPSATKTNKYIREHRLVMEKIIGRYLTKDEIVHHRNGIRNDNKPGNLHLMTKGKNWHPCLCPKCGFDFIVG